MPPDFVNFPGFELVSHSLDLWTCIAEHCEGRTLFSLLAVSRQLASTVRTELRARFAIATRPLLASTVTTDALWLMLEAQGGGVIGTVALSVWDPSILLPIHSLELSLPDGGLQSVEKWLTDRGYTGNIEQVPSEVGDVVKNQKLMVCGKVSLCRATFLQVPDVPQSNIVLIESRNSSPFTPLLEGRPTLLMNILTAHRWFVLYPNATFNRLWMSGSSLSDAASSTKPRLQAMNLYGKAYVEMNIPRSVSASDAFCPPSKVSRPSAFPARRPSLPEYRPPIGLFK